MTLSCKVGRFTFEDGTELSHAKAIRDAVMGQILDPKPDMPRLKTVENCYDFVRSNCSAVIADIPFRLSLS